MALILEIKVTPSSGRLQCILEGARLKCFLKAAPEKGRANKELIDYLAKMLHMKSGDIMILTGATGRIKRVQLETEKTFNQVCRDLHIERQLSLSE